MKRSGGLGGEENARLFPTKFEGQVYHKKVEGGKWHQMIRERIKEIRCVLEGAIISSGIVEIAEFQEQVSTVVVGNSVKFVIYFFIALIITMGMYGWICFEEENIGL